MTTDEILTPADAAENQINEPSVENNEIVSVLENENPVDEPSTENSDSILALESYESEASSDEFETHETHEVHESESESELETKYSHLNLEQLVTELETLVKEEDITKIKLKVGILKVRFLDLLKIEQQATLDTFLANGGVKEDFVYEEHPLEERFKKVFATYKKNKLKLSEELEKVKQQNLEAKLKILEELKVLIDTEDNLKKLYDKFKELQDQWKEIGTVPQNEVSNLWQNHHFYVEKFFDKLRISKELKDLDLKKNLEQKIEICEKAESLILENSINHSFKELQKLHELWRETGPVAEDKKEEIWERFKNATDQINQRRKEFYDKLYADQQAHYEAKLVLCDKAEQLCKEEFASIKELNELSQQFDELIKVWKTIGPASQKLNDEIWTRFREALNTFYTRKKEYLSKIKEGHLENYNAKVNLCIQAEAIAQRTDWKKATEEILNLQKEWKAIGPTSKKVSDIVWKRFRAACDRYFEAKSHFFAHINEHEAENLAKKEALIEKVKTFQIGEDRNAALEAVKVFQREWSEIGHVALKEKDRLYNEFKNAVNKVFENLKISTSEIRRTQYNHRIEEIMSGSDAKNILDKERRNLTTKLQALKDDVNLWENNLGFFAKSKNADILKQDFLKKIDKAKAEIKDLEEKIKLLVQKKG